jgi:hypothetical protein
MAPKKSFYEKDYRNILNYLYDYGDRSFEELPFTDADNLVLSMFAYVPFEMFEDLSQETPHTIAELAKDYLAWIKVSYFAHEMSDWMRKSLFLAMALLKGKRLSTAIVPRISVSFSRGNDEQFGAYQVLLSDKTMAIVFRGTDVTMTGWKEDFNLALQGSTPGQRNATDFTQECLTEDPTVPFRIMGHSKGGNFAVYSGCFLTAAQRKNLLCIYSDDGPGLSKELFESESHKLIVPKIRHIVPKEDIIGILLNHEKISYVVDADGDGDVANQHDGMAWKMKDMDFITVRDRTALSKFNEKSLSELVNQKLQGKERKLFIDAFFKTLEKTGITDMNVVFTDFQKFFGLFLTTALTEPRENRQILMSALGQMIACYRDHLSDYLRYSRIEKEQQREARLAAKQIASPDSMSLPSDNSPVVVSDAVKAGV